MNEDILRAAAERASGTAQRGDRPRQRRAGADGGLATARGPLAGVHLERAAGDGGALVFTGHASVTERGYELWDWAGPYTEVVAATAFDETLGRSGLDVPLVLDHDSMRRIARTTNGSLRLAMDETGLAVEADLDPADADVSYIEPKLRSGLIDEMSFRFRIIRGQWSPDYTEYRIEEVDIHRGDVAIVGYGANPATDGGLRSQRSPSGLLAARLALAIARA